MSLIALQPASFPNEHITLVKKLWAVRSIASALTAITTTIITNIASAHVLLFLAIGAKG